ncbi:sensor domain-containing protein [Paenibacillus tepidiphilus]|uniref:sensor domain-containing protein n=1 Tax=Paenibacillus tepidiphilus TaxID=2608683 RepID=UPI00123A9072|nr:sensor domain-containing protein [Paenibacillus tepidiphilus]
MNKEMYAMPIGVPDSLRNSAESQSKPRKRRTSPKMYRSLLYFIISLPVTIIYFVFMVAGLTLSIGLTPVFIGIPLFFAVAKGMDYIVRFEQDLVRSLLDIPGRPEEYRVYTQVEGAGFWQRMKLGFQAEQFVRNAMLILGRFVTSIVFFSLTLTLVAASLGLIALPVLHQIFLQTMDLNILENSVFALFHIDWTQTEQYIAYVVAGVVVGLIGNVAIRGLMDMQRRLLFVAYDEAEPYSVQN